MAIRPFATNPRYWAVNGEPTLLLGGGDWEHPFQNPTGNTPGDTLAEHLNALVAAGGNYCRCSLTTRYAGPTIAATDRYPWSWTGSAYDLDTLNTNFFTRLNTFLGLAEARGIVVQIELFDGFDWTDAVSAWSGHPMRGSNNVNYTEASTGVPETWTSWPATAWNPVHTAVYNTSLSGWSTIKGYLDAYINAVLDETLQFPNTVQYVDGNETSNPAAWIQYWAAFVKARAAAEPTPFFVPFGFMRDLRPADDPGNDAFYNLINTDANIDFVDVSQATHNDADDGGNEAEEPASYYQIRAVDAYTTNFKCPLDVVKVYWPGATRTQSSDNVGHKMGWRTFPRVIFAGTSGARFHNRSSDNLGLSSYAITRIQAMRAADDVFGFAYSDIGTSLISAATTEVRCRKRSDRVAVLFIGDGSCTVNLTAHPAINTVQWWDTHSGTLVSTASVAGGASPTLTTPTASNADSDFVAVLSYVAPTAPSAFLDGWQYRFKITSDYTKVDESVSNLVYNLANAPTGFWTQVGTGGGDIRVTASDGATQLAREIVGFDAVNKRGLLFLATPGLSTSGGTEFFVYYGNDQATEPAADSTYGSRAVWDSSYLLVSHQHQASPTNSCGSGISAATTGTPTLIDFGMHKGLRYTGNAYTDWSTFAGVQRPITVEQIFRCDEPPNNTRGTDTLGKGDDFGDEWCHTTAGKENSVVMNSTIVQPYSALAANTTHWRAFRATSTSLRTFVNGAFVGENTSTNNGGSGQTWIRQAEHWSGVAPIRDYAELRVSSTARSDAWISTHYKNQSNPAAFWVTGAQQPLVAEVLSVDQFTSNEDNPSQSFSVPTNTDLLVVIAAAFDGNADGAMTGVTLAGTPLTQARVDVTRTTVTATPDRLAGGVFYMATPPSGPQTLTASWTGTAVDTRTVHIYALRGATAGLSLRATALDPDELEDGLDFETITLPVASQAGDLVIGSIFWRNSATSISEIPTDQTERLTDDAPTRAYSFTKIGDAGSTDVEITADAGDPSNAYLFYALAIGDATADPPGKPSLDTVTACADTAIRGTVSENGNTTSIQIRAAAALPIDPINDTLVDTLLGTPPEGSFIGTGLAPDTLYYVYARALGPAGETISDVKQVTTWRTPVHTKTEGADLTGVEFIGLTGRSDIEVVAGRMAYLQTGVTRSAGITIDVYDATPTLIATKTVSSLELKSETALSPIKVELPSVYNNATVTVNISATFEVPSAGDQAVAIWTIESKARKAVKPPNFRAISPPLDGDAEQVSDGIVRLRQLSIPSGEYATPFWVVPDYDDRRAIRIDSLPARVIMDFGSVAIKSAEPEDYTPTHYAAPTAQGLGDGSSEANAFQIASFWAVASPGDVLQLADGTYTGANSMINPTDGLNGTAAAPITIISKTPGGALIDGEDIRDPIRLSNNDYLIVDGPNARNGLNYCAAILNSSTYNIIRKVCAWDQGGASVNENGAVFAIANSWGNLIEDCAGFGHGRRMYNLYESGQPLGQPSSSPITNPPRNVVRRCWGRGTYWEGTTKKVFQIGYQGYRDIVENCIGTFDAEGITAQSDTWRAHFCFGNIDHFNDVNNNCKYLGCIGYQLTDTDTVVLDEFLDGFGPASGSNEYRDIVMYAASGEVCNNLIFARLQALNGGQSQYTDVTEIGSGYNGSSIDADWTVTNRVRANTVVEAPNPFQPTAGEGARVWYRYVDGTLTGTKLWPWPMDARIRAALTTSGRDPDTIFGGAGNGLTELMESIFSVTLS